MAVGEMERAAVGGPNGDKRKKPIRPMTPDQSAFVEEHMPMAETAADILCRWCRWVEYGEALAVGSLTLIEMSRDHDLSRSKVKSRFGMLFPRRFQDWCRQQNLLGGMKRGIKAKCHLAADALRFDRNATWKNAGATHSLFDDNTSPVLPDTEDADDLCRTVIRGLPRPIRRAMLLHYAGGLTMKAVSERMGLSESRISQMISKGIAMLREDPAAVARIEECFPGASRGRYSWQEKEAS